MKYYSNKLLPKLLDKYNEYKYQIRKKQNGKIINEKKEKDLLENIILPK